jgi:transcriptional regulator with XRE-family HTH domain
MTTDTDKDTEHWKRFGKWLRAKRMERSRLTGLPRAELAKVCGVHDNSWANWERGGRNMGGHWIVYRPKPDNLYGIARALDVAPAEVFKRAGVRMDDDILVTVGPDGEDRIAWLMEAVGKLSDKLDALVEAQPHLKTEIEEVQQKLPRRRR